MNEAALVISQIAAGQDATWSEAFRIVSQERMFRSLKTKKLTSHYCVRRILHESKSGLNRAGFKPTAGGCQGRGLTTEVAPGLKPQD